MLLVCCLSQFMVVLDVSIVIVALPQMRVDLGLSASGQQWVLNAYTLTFAGLLMLGGRAADLFGRKRVFVTGLTVFTLCSLAGGLAQNGAWLIAARAAQGIGGAVLAPATLSLLTTTFTDPVERRRALGYWSTTAASGAAIGVLAGGILTDLFDWRWVLFVNVPIGIALVATAVLAVKEPAVATSGPRRHLDVPGAVTVTAGAATLVYGIIGTDTHAWGSTQTVVTLAVAAVLLIAFAVIESRTADPIVPLGIFRRRSLSVANLVAVTIGVALFGSNFFQSLYLQQVAGYTPLRAGLAFLPAGVATMTVALMSSSIVSRIGIRRQLVLAPLIAAAGLFWFSRVSVHSSYLPSLLPGFLLQGIGFGLAFLPMTVAATSGVPSSQAGLASGLINTTRQLGGAVGLAVLSTIAAAAVPHRALGVAADHRYLTTGYDRAFVVTGIALVVGAGVALLLPATAHRTATAAEPAPVVAVE